MLNSVDGYINANSPVWLGGSIFSFYKSDYTSRKLLADILAPTQVPSSVQMTKNGQNCGIKEKRRGGD